MNHDMKLVYVNVDLMKVFVIINSVGIMINENLNENNWLKKVDAMMDLFGILVCVNVNVINDVILMNIWIMQIVNIDKKWLINSCYNVNMRYWMQHILFNTDKKVTWKNNRLNYFILLTIMCLILLAIISMSC